MASTPLSLSSSSALINAKAPPRLPAAAAAAAAAAAVPTPPPPPSSTVHSHLAKTTAYCRKISRNVSAMATGEAPAAELEVVNAETPELVVKIQQAWENLEDKYAVTSLAVAGGVGLVACAGVISAIDKLPLIPGVMELVGIGYTGWFAYKNLISQPNREALILKIKGTYNDIIGSS